MPSSSAAPGSPASFRIAAVSEQARKIVSELTSLKAEISRQTDFLEQIREARQDLSESIAAAEELLGPLAGGTTEYTRTTPRPQPETVKTALDRIYSRYIALDQALGAPNPAGITRSGDHLLLAGMSAQFAAGLRVLETHIGEQAAFLDNVQAACESFHQAISAAEPLIRALDLVPADDSARLSSPARERLNAAIDRISTTHAALFRTLGKSHPAGIALSGKGLLLAHWFENLDIIIRRLFGFPPLLESGAFSPLSRDRIAALLNRKPFPPPSSPQEPMSGYRY